MDCDDTRSRLRDLAAGGLDPATRDALMGHLRSCPACARAGEGERVLDELLLRLPRHAAPAGLKERLGRLAAPETAWHAPEPRRWTRFLAPAAIAALALALALVLANRSGRRDDAALASLAAEVVNDHLRLLAARHPLDIESGGAHEVKPWFEGKLDFAPAVPLPEIAELRLQGGSVGYVFDRKAAVLAYALRRHAVTLLVFRGDGLAALDGGSLALGPWRARQASARGFHAILWREGELGHALVSDVEAGELARLATALASAGAR